MSETSLVGRGGRLLIYAACVVILMAGLKAASDLIGHLLLAAFIAVALARPVRGLISIRCPEWIAIPAVVLAVMVALVGFGAVITTSVAQFQDRVPVYAERLDDALQDFGERFGIDIASQLGSGTTDPGAGSGAGSGTTSSEQAPDAASDPTSQAAAQAADRPGVLGQMLSTRQLFDLISNTTLSLLGALSDLLILVLLVLLMLFESKSLNRKLKVAFGPNFVSEYATALQRVDEYLSIKTFVSLLTGVLATVACLLLDVPFALLWGLLAFAFNYIPNVGSLLAAIPAVVVAFLEVGTVPGIGLMLCYAIINIAIGMGVEPRLLGQRLGLSTVVVFVSLLLWAWILGPIGMLLAAPLTAILKILMEHMDDMRPVAVLLGGPPEPETATGTKP